MLDAHRYLNLVNERGKRGVGLERVYRNIRQQNLFLIAYRTLYANQGAMTAGMNRADTVDGMSLNRIDTIIERLAKGTYRWTPVRRTYIPKAEGEKRPLGIPGWEDKMVQEAIRLVLEAYYEPQFSTHSHGYRPQRGCHTALGEIVTRWKGTRWFIKGDIRGCFDRIDHTILLGLIGKKVKDNRLLKLLRQMLQTGYLEDWKYHQTYSGTPQGGVISPLLANIYLNELDQFVERDLKPQYTSEGGRKANPAYTRIVRQRQKAKGQGDREEYRRLTQQMYQTPSKDPMDPHYRRLHYVRYADDFILGFTGPKGEAEAIQEQVSRFLAETLNLELSQEKTLIRHAREPARFLGYDIRIVREDTKRTEATHGKQRALNGNAMLWVPQAVQNEWTRRYSKGGKSSVKAGLLHHTDYDIVMWYQAQLTGLVNYYQMAVNVSKLRRVKWTMETSLAKTLANKHKVSVRTIYKRYSYTSPETGLKGLRVELPRQDKPPLVACFGTSPIHYRRVTVELKDQQFLPGSHTGTELSARLQAERCELCASTQNVEVHHVRKLADIREQYHKGQKPAWVLKMLTIRRKTLVVCRECHRLIHAGDYDGPKIT